MIFQDPIEAKCREAELVASGVTANYMGEWDGLYVVAYEANERLPQRTLPTPAPETEMQYVNRRVSDGALWPTFCPITSPGWEQINAHPIEGRHEVGDTVLVFDTYAKPADKMIKARVDCCEHALCPVIKHIGIGIESYINFTKGDHLTEAERAKVRELETAMAADEQIELHDDCEAPDEAFTIAQGHRQF